MPIPPRKPFVLIDRDGTLIVNQHYQKDPALTELLPTVKEALRLLRDAGFGIAMVTNQSGIARGYLTLDDLAAVNQSVIEHIGDDGSFDGIYYCPHGPDDHCACRKPRTGMVEAAARDHGFLPRDAYVIGDSKADMQLGHAMGGTSVLVRTGYGAAVEGDPSVRPDHVADTLLDAARWIIQHEAARPHRE